MAWTISEGVQQLLLALVLIGTIIAAATMPDETPADDEQATR